MHDWFRELRAMPDTERARILARIAAGVIVTLLYTLGGFSLYLRALYLEPTVTVVPTWTRAREPTRTIPEATSTPTVTMTPTSTLYPTITPDRTRTAAARSAFLAGDVPTAAVATRVSLSAISVTRP